MVTESREHFGSMPRGSRGGGSRELQCISPTLWRVKEDQVFTKDDWREGQEISVPKHSSQGQSRSCVHSKACTEVLVAPGRESAVFPLPRN